MTPADKYFDLWRTTTAERELLDDALLTACGIDPREPESWPMTDITMDHYDSSFEFKEVKPGWVPTEQQLGKCWELGFVQCWICYTDGTEKHFYKRSDP